MRQHEPFRVAKLSVVELHDAPVRGVSFPHPGKATTTARNAWRRTRSLSTFAVTLLYVHSRTGFSQKLLKLRILCSTRDCHRVVDPPAHGGEGAIFFPSSVSHCAGVLVATDRACI